MTRLALALALSLMYISSAGAATIFEDDFDSEPTTGLNVTPQNWQIVNFLGAVDVIPSGTGGIECPGGVGNCIDGDGTLFDGGQLRTLSTFSLDPGIVYNIMFDYSGNQRTTDFDSMTVRISDGVNEPFSMVFGKDGDDPFSTESHNFQVATSGAYYIEFDHSEGLFQNDIIGLVYDNVKLSSVPEPSTVGLMLLGLGAIGYLRRRK